MRSFIIRNSHTLQASPDLMPLGAVLLAMMAVFAVQTPAASVRIDQFIGYGGCGPHHNEPERIVKIDVDAAGQPHVDAVAMSLNEMKALLRFEQSVHERVLVEYAVSPDIDYGQAMSVAAHIQNAGIPSHRVAWSDYSRF